MGDPLTPREIMANIKKNTQKKAKKKLDVINRGKGICRKWRKWGRGQYSVAVAEFSGRGKFSGFQFEIPR